MRRAHGRQTYKDGAVYEGEFGSESELKVCDGMMRWPDGRMYAGQWKGCKRDGKGTQVSADNLFYEGEFRMGMVEGFGKAVYGNGRYEFRLRGWGDPNPTGIGLGQSPLTR